MGDGNESGIQNPREQQGQTSENPQLKELYDKIDNYQNNPSEAIQMSAKIIKELGVKNCNFENENHRKAAIIFFENIRKGDVGLKYLDENKFKDEKIFYQYLDESLVKHLGQFLTIAGLRKQLDKSEYDYIDNIHLINQNFKTFKLYIEAKNKNEQSQQTVINETIAERYKKDNPIEPIQIGFGKRFGEKFKKFLGIKPKKDIPKNNTKPETQTDNKPKEQNTQENQPNQDNPSNNTSNSELFNKTTEEYNQTIIELQKQLAERKEEAEESTKEAIKAVEEVEKAIKDKKSPEEIEKLKKKVEETTQKVRYSVAEYLKKKQEKKLKKGEDIPEKEKALLDKLGKNSNEHLYTILADICEVLSNELNLDGIKIDKYDTKKETENNLEESLNTSKYGTCKYEKNEGIEKGPVLVIFPTISNNEKSKNETINAINYSKNYYNFVAVDNSEDNNINNTNFRLYSTVAGEKPEITTKKELDIKLPEGKSYEQAYKDYKPSPDKMNKIRGRNYEMLREIKKKLITQNSEGFGNIIPIVCRPEYMNNLAEQSKVMGFKGVVKFTGNSLHDRILPAKQS